MGDIRDIVVVVAGIIWSLVFLAILVAVLVVFALMRTYLNRAHSLLSVRVRGLLERVYATVETANARTGQLASRPALMPPPAQRTAPLLSGFHFSLPWQRKPWWRRALDRLGMS